MKVNLSPILVRDTHLFTCHLLLSFHASSNFITTARRVRAHNRRMMRHHLTKEAEIISHKFICLTQQWIKRFALSIGHYEELLNLGDSHKEHSVS